MKALESCLVCPEEQEGIVHFIVNCTEKYRVFSLLHLQNFCSPVLRRVEKRELALGNAPQYQCLHISKVARFQYLGGRPCFQFALHSANDKPNQDIRLLNIQRCKKDNSHGYDKLQYSMN